MRLPTHLSKRQQANVELDRSERLAGQAQRLRQELAVASPPHSPK